MQICPKCGYQRKLSDGCPDWQCPNCGVAYCKALKINQRQHRDIPVKTRHWKTLLSLIVVVSLLTIGMLYWKTRPSKKQSVSGPLTIEIANVPSAALSKEPIQIMVEGNLPSFEKNGYQLTPLAVFELEAKVLSSENYWLGRTADLSPTDLALGWGSMATKELLDKVAITQGNRWYYWYVARDFTQELGREISTHSSNMHIIPATPAVEKALSAVKKGQVVYIKGFLIQANANDGWKWRSSLSREDTGDGACELVWATELQVK